MAPEKRWTLDEAKQRKLEEKLGYRFLDPARLFLALVHSSAKDEGLDCNERLEFLGDSILGMVISDHLFHQIPDAQEGDLSAVKSVVVSSGSLAQAGRDLGLEEFFLLGRGISQKRPIPDSVFCNTFEALIAALYLDGGVEPARQFILLSLGQRIEDVLQDEHEKNYKSLLQQYTQRERGEVPQYRVVRESGPDHEKFFEVMVEFSGKHFGPGSGRTKKEAEQQAARRALETLSIVRPLEDSGTSAS